MNKMILYHGSDHIVHQPVYGGGKKNNDYGQGFYCTEHIDMAREWAVDAEKDGYVNSYVLPLEEMSVLNINSKEYSILNWLTLLISNRTFDVSTPIAKAGRKYLIDNFSLETAKYDIIRGYRADDSYFSFAQDFLNGTISLRQLGKAMYLGQLGEQVMIRSLKAFEALDEIDAFPVLSVEWYPKRQNRDLLARKQYSKMDKDEWVKGDIFMAHILDDEIKPGDIRLYRYSDC